jgi:hypothetical protein
VVAGALALLGVALAVTGVAMASTYQQLGIAGCLSDVSFPTYCHDALQAFEDQYQGWAYASNWLSLVPALAAILVGAPLVARELEHGTQRLVWTQSMTRGRWLGTKLALVLGGCLVAVAALSLALTWWRGPLDALGGRLAPDGFDFEGTAILGYTAFALALAIAAGALLRRAITAMVVTLAGFLAVRLPVEGWLRPRYLPALSATFDPATGAPAPIPRADWLVDQGWVDQLGRRLSDRQVYDTCLSRVPTKLDFLQCVHDHGWLANILYQPASRFWTFQAIETGLFVALAVGLLALAAWWVTRRVS